MHKSKKVVKIQGRRHLEREGRDWMLSFFHPLLFFPSYGLLENGLDWIGIGESSFKVCSGYSEILGEDGLA